MLKVNVLFLLLNLLLINNSYSQVSWVQLGNELSISSGYDYGRNNHLSGDGKTIAIGVQGNIMAQIYHLENNVWIQKGSDITNPTGNIGCSIDVSYDGNTVIIGNSQYKYISVYNWDGSSWNQKGSSIYGDSTESQLGRGVAISDDGNTIIVSSLYGSYNGTYSGVVKVFKWNGTDWTQKGNVFYGNHNDRLGYRVDINGDGSIIAISDSRFHGCAGDGKSRIFIYEYINSNWEIMGQAIEDLNPGNIGSHPPNTFSLNTVGKTIVVGDPGYDIDINGGNTSEGNTRVFNWDGNNWNQKGNSFYGDLTSEYLGSSVSINGEGNIIATVSNGYNGTNGLSNLGKISIYEWSNNTWNQIGNIEGIYDNNDIVSTNLDASGATIVFGATSNHILAYSNPNYLATNSFSLNNQIKIYPNPTTSNITIELKDNNTNNVIKIFDISGKLVTNYNLLNHDNLININVNNLESGVYLITIIDPMTNEVKQTKFVKQ